MFLEEKVALVTGASRGIGRAIAIALARQGATVIVNYAGSKEKADEVVQYIKGFGGEALAYQADVSQASQVDKMIKESGKELGGIDILVNNAGITRDTLLLRMKEDNWNEVLDTNLKGAFLCTKAVTRSMLKRRSGRIINISSVVGITGNAGQANYAAAKAGLIGLTKSNAKEFAAKGITVNAIAPGFIATDMTDDITEDMKEKLLTAIPVGELGKPEDIANLVVFLASDKSGYITGQTINVDGGMVM